MKFIINTHSFIDVITNSSSEIFICDTTKSLDDITALVKNKEKKWPNKYGEHVNIYLDDASSYYDYDCNFNEYQISEMIEFLEKYGFKIIPPKEELKSNPVIVIACETGLINPQLKEWIIKTFNSKLIDG